MLDQKNKEKLKALKNTHVEKYVEEAIKLCKPDRVLVLDDSEEDLERIRQFAIEKGEEKKLALKGHTIHYDGPKDQARDKENTKYLLSKEVDWGLDINYVNKEKGLDEVLNILDGSMAGKDMFVRLYCLGPTNSEFSIRALQITDSAYVSHSEDILYRPGYEEFKSLNGSDDFFVFLHSAGELENNITKNVDKRRIYIDIEENRVYTVNNQYAGNSVGLKKLAFRLAIQKAQNEGWLAEHMFVMGVHGKKDRVTYFTGAFPSACGKTSTAMIPGQTIIGDDIAYLRKKNGVIKAVNVERGIFGIIQDVNPDDDPEIYNALTTPGEVIFSNVLVNNGKPYWLGSKQDIPDEGTSYCGLWKQGMKDEKGNEIPYAHKNARYTLRIDTLNNADENWDAKEGVEVSGIVYGGRDSDTTVPVVQARDWEHGVFLGATVESETTAATLGKEGVRKHNPMANLDFISVPLGTYIDNHMKFIDGLDKVPSVFATNYFLRNEEGKFCNSKLDKKVWILWAEGRVNGDYEAIETPVGFIPKYEDLKDLFKDVFNKDYTKTEYIEQFSIRVDKYIAKMERMTKLFSKTKMPDTFTNQLNMQVKLLNDAKNKYGAEISPFDF
jgi:phosphoenolpyruvate carboxykinase (GTP)